MIKPLETFVLNVNIFNFAGKPHTKTSHHQVVKLTKCYFLLKQVEDLECYSLHLEVSRFVFENGLVTSTKQVNKVYGFHDDPLFYLG